MNKKVFVSYSWDDPSHEKWIVDFTNELRKNSIDAEIDKFITQEGTVNLNQMMVEKIREADFTIIVMTENYAKRADSFEGGVGFESQLLLNLVRTDSNKIIPILKKNSKSENVIPFFLQGFEYINFTNAADFAQSFQRVLNKINKTPMYHKEPLGVTSNQDYSQVDLIASEPTISMRKEIIPNLRKITDIDKKKYLQNAFKQICVNLKLFSDETKKIYDNFEYHYEELTSREIIISFYLNGSLKRGVRIWIAGISSFSNESIMISNDIGSFRSSGFNEMISCEIDDGNIILKPLMKLSDYDSWDIEGISEGIWKDIVRHLKY